MSELTTEERKRLAKNILTAGYMSVGFSREYGHDVAKLMDMVDTLELKLLKHESASADQLKEIENYWEDRIGRSWYIVDMARHLAGEIISRKERFLGIDSRSHNIVNFAEEILIHAKRLDDSRDRNKWGVK